MKNLQYSYKLFTIKKKQKTKTTIKFTLNNLYNYTEVKKLMEFVRNHQFLSKTIFEYPVITRKLHRNYLTNFLKKDKKLQYIKGSYIFIDEYFPQSIREKLYNEGFVILSKLSDKYTISLKIYNGFDREGEFSLTIDRNDNTRVSTLSFSIRNNTTVLIGGVQGSYSKEEGLIKNVTKDLYGIFPKKILIETLYNIEESLGLSLEKYGVGNEVHIFTTDDVRESQKVKSDYNLFWKDLNSTQERDLLWKLPKVLKRKEILDIPSKKRSKYRKRFNLLDELKNDIFNVLNI